MILIVPTYIHDAIHAAIDTALDGRILLDEEREMIYSQLLDHFNDHGLIPQFTLKEKDHGDSGSITSTQ